MTAFRRLLLVSLALPAGSAPAQSLWSGAADSAWSNPLNWDVLPAGGPILFNGPGANPPTNNDLPSLSASGLTFGNPLAAPVTLGGNAITLAGGITNLNTVAARTVTIGTPLVIAANQVWNTANDVDAVTLIAGGLSGSGNITFNGSLGSNSTTIPNFRLSGNNAGYTGTISTPGADSFGFLLMGPQAQTGGLVDLNSGNRNLWLAANAATNAYTFWTGNTTPLAGEPMRVNFRNAGTSGLYLTGGDVHWNPTSSGSDFVWDAPRTGAHTEIRFNGSSDTATAPAIATPRLWHFGNDTGSFVLGGNRAITNGGGGSNPSRVRMKFALSDDGAARQISLGASLTILTRPAGGGPFTPSLAGATVLNTGATAISDMNQIFNGWLQMNGGVTILDGVSWTQFMADRSAGYRASAGADAWGITNGSSGFAARGAPVDIHIDANPGAAYGTITAGAVFNRDFAIGSGVRDNDGSLYANQSVIIRQPTSLTSARVIRVSGGNQERTTAWTVEGPVHEISGALDGAFALTLGGGGTQSGGTLRLSNTNNTFASLTLNPAGQPGGLIVLATDDAVLGAGAVTVSAGSQGQAALLLFENQTPTAKAFSRVLTIAQGGDASGGDSGFGSWAGEVLYAGTATITGSRATLPFHVQGGSFIFSTGATLKNDSTASGQFVYNKGGAGTADLRQLSHAGGAKTDWKWVLYEGGLVSSSPAQVIGPSSAALRASDLVGPNLILAGIPLAPRAWRVRDADHLFTGVINAGGYGPGVTVDVEAGRVLSLDFGASNFTPTESLGQTTATPAWKLVKTGGGSWVMRNSLTSVGFGPTNGAGFLEVQAGTLDLTGDFGRGSVRLLDGGTLLSGSHSPFTYGTGAGFQLGVGQIGLMEIQGSGGRIGISPGAAANVSRAAGIAWTQQAGCRLTLAARDSLDLVFANAAFPDVAAGSELRIERDGAGSGLVRLNDTGIAVNGILSGAGVLSTGASGGGMVTVHGSIRPGADGPGILGVGNTTFSSIGALELQLNGNTPGTGYDRLDLTGGLVIEPGAQLHVSFGYGPATGTVFTVVNNDGADVALGVFSKGATALTEGGAVSFGSVTCSISYVGGDGNDVTLTVVSSSPTGYAVWVTGFGLAPADQDETDDSDGDGMNNLLEYFAGLDPSVANPPMMNALDASPATLRFVFQRSNTAPDLAYSYEWSTDMVNWFSPDPSHTFTETVIGGSPDTPLVRTTLTVPGGTPRIYARIRIVRN